MNNKIKYVINSILFLLLLTTVFLLNILKDPEEVSISERRKLKGFPSISITNLLNGEFIDDFEGYTKDQFILRDNFRSLKAFIHFNVFRQKDNNNIYIVDGSVIKIDYPMNEKSVYNAADKLNSLSEKYFKGMNVWYSIIPDKNYFTAQKNGYPSIDYISMLEVLNANVKNMKYIDITDSLTIDDYYKTDIHWKQENLDNVLNKLAKEMGYTNLISVKDFNENKLYPFYGVYYGQSALNISPDTLIYLTNKDTDKLKIHYVDNNKYGNMYMPELFSGIDPYNLYLSGPAAIITIENDNAKTNKELILFRDSFGSSLAPLLTQEYSKITLIDLRYVSSDYLGKVISFNNQDILIMLNTQIINNSYMLR